MRVNPIIKSAPLLSLVEVGEVLEVVEVGASSFRLGRALGIAGLALTAVGTGIWAYANRKKLQEWIHPNDIKPPTPEEKREAWLQHYAKQLSEIYQIPLDQAYMQVGLDYQGSLPGKVIESPLANSSITRASGAPAATNNSAASVNPFSESNPKKIKQNEFARQVRLHPEMATEAEITTLAIIARQRYDRGEDATNFIEALELVEFDVAVQQGIRDLAHQRLTELRYNSMVNGLIAEFLPQPPLAVTWDQLEKAAASGNRTLVSQLIQQILNNRGFMSGAVAWDQLEKADEARLLEHPSTLIRESALTWLAMSPNFFHRAETLWQQQIGQLRNDLRSNNSIVAAEKILEIFMKVGNRTAEDMWVQSKLIHAGSASLMDVERAYGIASKLNNEGVNTSNIANYDRFIGYLRSVCRASWSRRVVGLAQERLDSLPMNQFENDALSLQEPTILQRLKIACQKLAGLFRGGR